MTLVYTVSFIDVVYVVIVQAHVLQQRFRILDLQRQVLFAERHLQFVANFLPHTFYAAYILYVSEMEKNRTL